MNLKKENLTQKEIHEILKIEYKNNLKQEEINLVKNKIQIVTIFDKDYPIKLKEIYDPPVVLYIKGNKEILNSYCIAMVGCRMCSNYGKQQAEKFSFMLAKNNVTVVSGLARGIDRYSHLGTLAANGKTIAVLGNGLHMIYPMENLELARKIISTGGVIVTEYPFETNPEKENFPKRNRIISGISDSVIVVEAKRRSGSIITAELALEQGKDVYGVPGNIDSKNSEGTNELIKDGAIMLTKAEDIIKKNRRIK